MIKINYYLIIATIFLTTVVMVVPSYLHAETDPGGTKTGTINDVAAATAGEPTLRKSPMQSGIPELP